MRLDEIRDPRSYRALMEERPQDDVAAAMPQQIAALRDSTQPVWIFAYGSLIWDPGFSYAQAEPALLRGYHRSFCLYSYDYRGTPAQPGLILGLDRGGSCRGMALLLPPDTLRQAIDRIWWREMSGRRVYDARLLPVQTRSSSLKALGFTVLRDCPDYAGGLPLDNAARLILSAVGRRGRCRDYFESTVRHLERLDLLDRPLRRLAERVEMLAALQDTHAGV
jgi:cation transport protein ChaC